MGVFRRQGVDEAYEFTATDTTLTLMPFNAPLRAFGPDSFGVEGGGLHVVTEGPAGPAPVAKLYLGNDPARVLDRVPKFKPTPAELDDFTGTYYSEELDVRYTVERKDSVLTLNLRRRGKLTMNPSFADAFNVAGLGTVRFIREKGKVTSFRVTQVRVRNVLFKKSI